MAKDKPALSGRNYDPVETGRRGGRIGGVRRALALSPTRRAEIARKAAMARWGPLRTDRKASRARTKARARRKNGG